MQNPLATPLDMYTPIADLSAPVAVEYADGEQFLFEFDKRSGARTRARVRKISNGNGRYHQAVAINQPLGDFAVAAVRKRPVRVVALPADTTLAPKRASQGPIAPTVSVWLLAAVLAISVVTGLLTGSGLAWLIAAVMALSLGAFGVRKFAAPPPAEHPPLKIGGSPYEGYEVFAAAEAVAQPVSDGAAEGAVDEIKTRYAALVSDILYRLENPALFDVAVPTTRRFTTALLLWDDTADDLPAGERAQLAAEVRLTFEAAKAHAETVGLNHAAESDREQIGRAAKAIRLAEDTANPAEAKAARTQAIRILESLALYYLPTVDEAEAIIAGRPILALPGRREQDDQ